MKTEKSKGSPRRFSRIKHRLILLVLILVLGTVVCVKDEGVQARLYNLLHPVTGEILFTADFDDDIDIVPQLYRMTFNTALGTTSTPQRLTALHYGGYAGRYSPDGTRIVFISSPTIFVVNADGTHLHALTTTRGSGAFWADNTHIIFNDQIGTYPRKQSGKYPQSCSLYGPFVYDFETGGVLPLYTIPKTVPAGSLDWTKVYMEEDGELWFYKAQSPSIDCETYSLGNLYLPAYPTGFSPIYQPYEEAGLLDHAIDILAGTEVLSPSGTRLVRSFSSSSPTGLSGIHIYDPSEKQWRFVVSGSGARWSPDEKYLIYTTRNPDDTENIMISSVDGSWTYKLFTYDGQYGLTPTWRPSSGD